MKINEGIRAEEVRFCLFRHGIAKVGCSTKAGEIAFLVSLVEKVGFQFSRLRITAR